MLMRGQNMFSVRTAIALILAAGSAAPAFAESWVNFEESGSGSVYYLDVDTFSKTGDIVLVWTKADHSRDRTETARETKTRYRINCLYQTISVLFWADYRPDGSVIDSHMVQSYEQEARPIVPGTIGETLAQLACSAK
jgi:hypothetical protein